MAAWAQTAENVAVVINEASPDSTRVGEYYARVRGVPSRNVIRLTTTVDEQILPAEYTRTIETPIARALNGGLSHDRILYVVLTKGIPLRITGTGGRMGTGGSVDSELALLYRRMAGSATQAVGPVPNPYFLGDRPIQEAKSFTHRTQDIFLVTRLDGFTVEDVIALIDRGLAAAASGRVVLDGRGGKTAGDAWIGEAAARLKALGAGERVVVEDTPRAARGLNEVIGYFSWGANDPENRVRRVGLGFLPGALATTISSTDGRTFQAPPDTWRPPADPSDKASWFAGSPQTLAGDLIREGVSGVAANVGEPYLDGAVRPEILFPAYFAGFNLAESFYLALPHIGWQTVVVGDPLAAPFRKTSLTAVEIEEPIDARTGLPGAFSRWRMQAVGSQIKHARADAVALVVMADALAARGDTAGARRALERAVGISPDVAAIWMSLALLYENAGDHDRAIEAYRRLLEIERDNVIALNNLAYGLAVRRKAPAEALPYARRAVALAPTVTIIDTLAWIEHLLGNDRDAAARLGPLVQKGRSEIRSTGNSEVHLHAAIIFAATADLAAAQAQLAEAVRLEPTLSARDDVRTLRARLGGR